MRADVRIALFYALCFGAFGVSLPYWPLWLAARGLAPDEIGLLFAASMLAKIVATPVAAALADRLERRRALIAFLSLMALLATLLYAPAAGFPAILAIAVVAALFVAPIMSLTDSLALTLSRDGSFDYGRVRLFGSAGFLIVALATGTLIGGRPPDFILWLMVALLAAAFAAALALPELPRSEARRIAPAFGAQLVGIAALLKRPSLRWFLLAAGLIQNSHLGYYAFGTLYWRQAGLSPGTIGFLWAEGVVAEIVLFAAAPALGRRLGAERLILLGGAGAAVRWLALGLSTDLAVLVPMQLLHALSFAAAHLGAMLYLARAAPPGLSASAQGLYAALPLGIGSGLVYVATGLVFAHYGGGAAFLAMAGLAGAGMGVMWWVVRPDSRHVRVTG